jgi:CheY-like chemotaxis protein
MKIIVLSAYLDEEKFKKMKEYGADACFSKPFPLPQLKEEVARLLELR